MARALRFLGLGFVSTGLVTTCLRHIETWAAEVRLLQGLVLLGALFMVAVFVESYVRMWRWQRTVLRELQTEPLAVYRLEESELPCAQDAIDRGVLAWGPRPNTVVLPSFWHW